jgi:hypothetical protein
MSSYSDALPGVARDELGAMKRTDEKQIQISDNPRAPHAIGDHPIRTPCGAKTRAGTPCRGWAMSNGRCRMHGGSALAGIASPTFRHGLYSKVLPKRLKTTFDALASQHDGDMLDLTPELLLFQARLTELLEHADALATYTRIAEIRKSWRALTSAQRRGDPIAVTEAVATLDRLIDAAATDLANWQEIERTVARLQSL